MVERYRLQVTIRSDNKDEILPAAAKFDLSMNDVIRSGSIILSELINKGAISKSDIVNLTSKMGLDSIVPGYKLNTQTGNAPVKSERLPISFGKDSGDSFKAATTSLSIEKADLARLGGILLSCLINNGDLETLLLSEIRKLLEKKDTIYDFDSK